MDLHNQINKIIQNSGYKSVSRVITSKKNVLLLNELINNTSFLDSNAKASERIFCLLNNINSVKKCKECKVNPVIFKGLNKKGGYAKFCSVKCSRNNIETIEKYKKTSFKNYGVYHPSISDIVKQKKENTFMKKYGYKTSLLNPDIKNRIKETNIAKYGAETPLLNKSVIIKIKNTNIKKYGTEYVFSNEKIKNKIKQINLKKYGTFFPTQSKIIQNKIQNTNISKYGVKYVLSSDIIKEKIKKTKIKKYGYYNANKNIKIKNNDYKLIIEKTKQNNIKKYGYYNVNKKSIDKHDYNQLISKFNIELSEKIIDYKLYDYIKCNKCGYEGLISKEDIYNRLIRYNISPCYNCNPKGSFSISGIELKFTDFIKEIYKGKIEQSNRKILNGKEIDIFLPELNIGIEIHGLYWHNNSKKEDKNYHYEKYRLAKEKGIHLYQFFDDEIEKGMMLIYSAINNKNKLKKDIDINVLNKDYNLKFLNNFTIQNKYYSRKLKLKTINNKISNNFLNNYHIQGKDSSKYRYGLYTQDNILLSILTFKTMSVDKNQQRSHNTNENILTFELSRYVTLPGIQIIGGFSRLMKAFRKDMDRLYLNDNNDLKIKILTYSNLRYSNEDYNVYLRNGFTKVGHTGINYYYFFEGRKMHRFNFRKDNLYNKFLPERSISVDTDYTKESEKGMVQKLIDNGFPVSKVFDAGHIKWFKEL